MAKAAIAETLPVSVANNLPAELLAQMEADAGKGVSTAAEDNTVPLVYVLQTNSPQVNSRHEKYVEGAQAGDIWIKGIGVFTEIEFQPAYFKNTVVEWVPRDDGGGFVGQYNSLPRDAEEHRDEVNPRKVKYSNPENGNEYKETKNHAGIAYVDGKDVPCLLPLTGASLKVSRDWMSLIGGVRVGNNVTPPSFAVKYKLSTKLAKNKLGEWFMLDVTHAGKKGKPLFVNRAEYAAGKALHAAFKSGEKIGQEPVELNDGGTTLKSDEEIPF